MSSDRPQLPRLIAQLARDATPVTPLPSPAIRCGAWLLSATAAAAIVTIVLGLRPHVGAHLQDTRFVAAAIATFGLAVAAAASAFVISVPGNGDRPGIRALPLLAVLPWATLLWWRLTAAASADGIEPIALLAATRWHPVCVLLILTIAALPGIALFTMLRRAAPLHAWWTGALAALASLALGGVGTQFVCPIDAPGHQLLWHFTPVVLLTFTGLFLGARFFDWRRLATGTIRGPR